MVIFVLWPCFSSILCFHVVSQCVRYNHPHTPLATSTTSKGTIRLRCPTCGTKRGTWHLYCTCWWCSLCNLEYWSKYTNTFSYNLGCWIDPSKFFHRFLVCLTLPLRSILTFFLQCSTRYKVHAWKLGEPVECMPCQNALFQPSVNDTGELVIVFRICYLFDQILLEYSKVYLLIQWCWWFFFQKYLFRYHGVSVQLEKPRRKRYGQVYMLDANSFDWLQLVPCPDLYVHRQSLYVEVVLIQESILFFCCFVLWCFVLCCFVLCWFFLYSLLFVLLLALLSLLFDL